MDEVNKRRLIFILFFLLLFITCGCNLLNSHSKQLDPVHVKSCGPKAIKETLTRHYRINEIKFKKEITLEEISRDIKDDGSPLRCFLTFFSEEARAITWPSEVVKFFKERGFKIKKIKDLDELKKEGLALVLIHKKGKLSSYHWVSYSENKNIKKYFGDNTIVDFIYIITKDQFTSIIPI